MKQLKFMLAAATAVGIAAAAQAGATADKILVDDDFNDAVWEGKNPVDVKLVGENSTEYKSGYSFLPTGNATAADNESKVENGVLKVNTGTDPLLRALDFSKSSDAAQDVNLAATDFNYLNIDATVQFTVTPIGDKVTATANDKLMIFLKEVAAAEEGGESTTKLKVKALQYKAATEGAWNPELGAYDDPVPAIMITNDWDVIYTDDTEVAVEANTPYNLSVKTELVDGVPMFKISLGGKEIKPVENLHLAAANSSYFPSLLGPAEKTLTSVGFAGEGTVDDLVVTKNYDVSALDFTFTWSGDGITGVTYTIGEDTYEVTSGTAFQVQPGTSFTVNVALADWYKLAQTSYVYNNVTEGDKVEIPSAEKVITTEPAADGSVTVNPNATPDELAAVKTDAGITGGAFKDSGAEELGKALTWKNKNNVSDTDVSAVAFDEHGNPAVENGVTNVAAQAYLLNCPVDETTIKTVVAPQFKFTAISFVNGKPVYNVSGSWTDNSENVYNFNGQPAFQGATTLGQWHAVDADGKIPGKDEGTKVLPSFFKATLINK